MEKDEMTGLAEPNGGRTIFPWRIVGWGLAAGLLLLPAVAMQFTTEVNWDGADFLFAGVLIGAVGLGLEFLVRRSGSLAYRVGAALAMLAAFLVVWANAAVGMIGSEDNPYNLLFLGVVALALLGAIVARFRAAGMARMMAAAGLAHALIGAYGLTSDTRGAILSVVLAGPWFAAAWLFGRAARQP